VTLKKAKEKARAVLLVLDVEDLDMRSHLVDATGKGLNQLADGPLSCCIIATTIVSHAPFVRLNPS
jgi:hypothetical protein